MKDPMRKRILISLIICAILGAIVYEIISIESRVKRDISIEVASATEFLMTQENIAQNTVSNTKTKNTTN